MNLSAESLRSDFHVLIVESQAHVLHNYVTLFQHAGYQVDSFAAPGTDVKPLLQKIRQSPPHIVVLGLKDFDHDEPILRSIQQLSSEIQIIVLTAKMMMGRALQLIDTQKITDCVALPLVSPLELILRVDQVALRLYYQYENELLRTKAADSAPAPTSAHHELELSSSLTNLDRPSIMDAVEKAEGQLLDAIEQSFGRFYLSRDPGQTLQAFLQMSSDICHGKAIAYFKFLPHHFSFVYSHGVNFPAPALDLKNVGIDLRSSGLREPSEVFAQVEGLPELKALMAQVFKTNQFEVFPHLSEGEGLGFFAMLGSAEKRDVRKVDILLKIFSLCYEKNVLLRQKASFEIRDPLTSLYSLSYFEQKLKEELSRARRLGLPLALLALRLDRFEDLQKEIGSTNADTILKMVAILLKKTSRVNDVVAAYDRGRILLLLPHTDHGGAKIKADRLRMMIGTARFPLAESKGWGAIKVSLGVCDYPNLASDGEDLVRQVLDSLQEAQSIGGDRVVVPKPKPGFQPDFKPQNLSPITSFMSKDRSHD